MALVSLMFDLALTVLSNLEDTEEEKMGEVFMDPKSILNFTNMESRETEFWLRPHWLLITTCHPHTQRKHFSLLDQA